MLSSLGGVRTITRMTDTEASKCYLSQILNIDKEINSKMNTANSMRRSLTNIGATRWKDIEVQESHTYTAEDKMAEYIDMESEVDKRIDELIKLKRKVMAEIENVDDRLHRIVLTERYINNQKWGRIAELYEYESERQVHNLHGSALQEFYECNKDEVEEYSKEVEENAKQKVK